MVSDEKTEVSAKVNEGRVLGGCLLLCGCLYYLFCAVVCWKMTELFFYCRMTELFFYCNIDIYMCAQVLKHCALSAYTMKIVSIVFLHFSFFDVFLSLLQ